MSIQVMSIHHMLAAFAAMALFFAAAPSSAQEKPNSSAATKPNTGPSSTSKPSNATTQPPLHRNGVNSNAPTERTGTKQGAPAAAQTAPAGERNERSCGSRDSDA